MTRGALRFAASSMRGQGGKPGWKGACGCPDPVHTHAQHVEGGAIRERAASAHARSHARPHPHHAAAERQAAQHALGTGFLATEIHPQLDALGRRQHHVGLVDRPLQQAAVRPDHLQRAAVAPGKLVKARVRGVQQTDPVGGGGHALDMIGAPVDEDPIAGNTHHQIHPVVRIDKLVGRIEAPILKDPGELELARWQAALRVVVLDDEQSDKPTVDLTAGTPMRMGVEPVHTGPVGDDELVDIALAGRDRIHWMAVHLLHDVQPVPMHDRFLRQLIPEEDAQPLPLAYPDHRQRTSRQRRQCLRVALEHLARELPEACRRTREQLRGALGRGQLQLHVRVERRARLRRETLARAGDTGRAPGVECRKRRTACDEADEATPVAGHLIHGSENSCAAAL